METTTTQKEINERIYNSNSVVKNGLRYDEPKKFLDPIINLLGDENIFLQGSDPIQIGDTENQENLLSAFQRLSLIKKFEIDEELSYQIGFVYALDLAKPIIKVFSGVNVHACTNLCVFRADRLKEFLILQGTEGAQPEIKNYLENLAKDMKQAKQIIFDMKNTKFTRFETRKMFGTFIDQFSAVKNIAGVQCILDAARQINEKNSLYYFEEDTNAWNLYNALTHDICNKKHIVQQPEKVLYLFNEMKKHKAFIPSNLELQLN